jgi:site-specific recombinase XerD
MIQLQQVMTAFLAAIDHTGTAAVTQRNYRHDLQLIGRALHRQSPGLPMMAITTAHLQAVLQAVAQRADGAPRSLDARMRMFTVLRIVFHWAHRTGLCESDPTLALAPPTTSPLPDTVILTEDAIDTLRRVVWQDTYPPHLQLRQAIILEFLLTTGLHLQELVHLNIADLDLPQRIIRVRRPRNSIRMVRLSPRLCHYLEEYLAWRQAHAGAPEPALLLSARKGRLSAITVWTHLAIWGTWAQLPFRLNARIFHATFATRLFAITQDALVVMEALGGRRSLAALLAIRPVDITLREVVDAL